MPFNVECNFFKIERRDKIKGNIVKNENNLYHVSIIYLC